MNQISRDQHPNQSRDASAAPAWQAADRNWYPSQGHQNYAAPPPPPPGFHSTGPSGHAANAPTGPLAYERPASENLGLATAKGIVAKFSASAGLLYAGFVFAAIALFLPWTTVSANSPFGGSLQIDASPFQGVWMFVILLVIAGAAWLAWPTVSKSHMSVKRLAGLSGVVCLLIGCFFVGVVNYVNGVSEKQQAMTETGLGGAVDISLDFGFVLYTAAVIAIVVGVVRVWKHHAKRS